MEGKTEPILGDANPIPTVKGWLEAGTIDIFLGYKLTDGHPLPHGFVRERLEEVEALVDSPYRYPLEKFATHLLARHPQLKIGMFARDCNQRAINVLTIFNQLPARQIRTIRLNCCPSALKSHADCSYLRPRKAGPHKIQKGIDNSVDPAQIEAFDPGERLGRWTYEFQKCIKCYGCRNICPVCFCTTCSLEHDELVATGPLPPEVPIFHLVRAVHMAGRCVDCGLCEAVCPMDIPLRLLYRKVNEIVAALFAYEAGTRADRPPMNISGEEVTLEPKPIEAGEGR
jgi:Na+-translocating ferredoxin:NAD+ oxidoreductase RnfC subunit